MSRPRTIAIGTFILLLAATPFIPRGDDNDGALLPSGDGAYDAGAAGAAETAGFGAVTPELAAEIDRVVTQGEATGRSSGRRTPVELVSTLVRCADFEGQRYCLSSGWTDDTQAQVQARMTMAARAAVSAQRLGTETTGDLDEFAALQRLARMSPKARAAEERQELTMAARSVAKVWLLRHEIEGVALPADFLANHPEARADTSSAPSSSSDERGAAPTADASTTKSPSPSPTKTPTATPTKTPTASPSADSDVKHRSDYPRRAIVLDPTQVADQVRTYWCGPTSMQMIAWGWKNRDKGAAHWADRLGTTSSGSSISEMVRVVNESTGWDREDYAGPYIVLDIGSWSFKKWELLLMRHIVDYRAPLILHPILLKRYYPYLDDDASGHFQVGRGYDKRGKKADLIGYFEPWNQQRFDPSEPYIARVQWRSAYKSFRGNQAHYQHNIGV